MKLLALGLSGLALCGTLAIAQGRGVDGGQRGERRSEARHSAGHGSEAQRFAPRWARRAEARRFLRDLDITPAQRALARQEAEALAPAARAARDEFRSIRDAARAQGRDGDRAGARDAARERLEQLRERTRAEFAPHGRALLESLTPEQRARIEARLARHGRTFDLDRASERVGRWLARPRVQERLGVRPEPGPRTGGR